MENYLTKLPINEIICGDSLQILKTFPDKSIDLVLTDPPYGTTACAWDEIAPLDLMWQEIERVTKDGGAMIFTASQPFTSKLVMSNINHFRHEWIYKKRCASNFAQATYAPMKEHESVLVFGSKKVYYYPIKEQRQGSGKDRARYAYGDKSRHASGDFVGNIKGEYDRDNDAGNDEMRYPSSVQEFNNRASGDRGFHPTQKPVALMAYLIKTYSTPNAIVLDLFAGSGSTLVAAKQESRNYIGIELSSEYCEIARKRVEVAIQYSLPLAA